MDEKKLSYDYFWNSKKDRYYDADSMADWLRPFFSNGVFSGQMQVTANNDMSVTVAMGYGYINGKHRHFLTPTTLALEVASGTLNRIDSVILRRNDTERRIHLLIVKGGNAATPTAPKTTREGTIYDLKLADIYIAAGTAKITQAEITDTRMNADVCGWVCGTVNQIEFEQIYAQFKAFQESKQQELIEKINEWGNIWDKWFQMTKDQLESDTAGHLQNQIGNLEELTTEDNSSLTAALNEVKSSLTEGINEAKESGGVTGVKGQKEAKYRKGNVNITAENIGALPTAGGAMTGNIDYQGTKARHTMIKFLDNILDGYGNGIEIGGGGAVIIGGGESAQNIEPLIEHSIENPNGGIERLLLCNDQGIDFYTGVQRGADAAVHTQITNQGVFINKGLQVEVDNTTSNIYLVRRVDGVEQRRGRIHISSANNLGMWDDNNNQWVYIAPLDGTPRFLGNADTATKATQDGLGNVIANTYLSIFAHGKISAANGYADIQLEKNSLYLICAHLVTGDTDSRYQSALYWIQTTANRSNIIKQEKLTDMSSDNVAITIGSLNLAFQLKNGQSGPFMFNVYELMSNINA